MTESGKLCKMYSNRAGGKGGGGKIKVKVKVKFTLEQVTKTQRASRDIALLFL
jgi:predicted secreted Zn-dependent protease